MEKTMVLKNHGKNHGFNLHSQGMQVTLFSWFFKVIGRKYYIFLENHGFEKPWFSES
jgi:hypothetical protein